MNKLFLQNMELFLKVRKRNKLICIGAKLMISFPLANDTNTCLMQNKVLRLNTLIHVLMDWFFHLGIISTCDPLWLSKHLHFFFYSSNIHISAHPPHTDAPGCPDLCFDLPCLTIMKPTDWASLTYRQFIMCVVCYMLHQLTMNPLMPKHLNIYIRHCLNSILFFCHRFKKNKKKLIFQSHADMSGQNYCNI